MQLGISKSRKQLLDVTKYAVILAAGWTLLVVGLVLWTARQQMQNARELVRNEARAHFLKDQAIRSWAAGHGGIYVPCTEHTLPNPHLSHIPDRDIETMAGRNLTLMNPAHMMCQLMEEYEKLYGIKGRITCLKAQRPDNMPDEWERAALESFDRGETEANEFTEIDGEPYVRLMRPMITDHTYLKCHEHQGCKEGEVRGGVGVLVPAGPFFAQARKETVEHSLAFGLLWLLGLAGLVIGTRHIQRRGRERRRAEEALRESEERFKKLSNVTFEGILIHDKGVTIDINESLTRLLGYTREEMIGENIIELCVPREYHATIRKNIAKSHAKPYEVMARKKDGTLFPIEVEARETKVEDKTYRVTAIRDITERWQAEEELRRYERIVSSSNDMLALLDENFVYLAVNERYVTAFGKTRSELIDATVSEVFGETFFETVIRPNAEKCLQGHNYGQNS